MGKELSGMQEMAREAGKLMRQGWGRDLRVYQKADQTVVTEVDLAISRLVCEAVQAEWPGYGLLTEETAATNTLYLPKGFIVDELDGTFAYVNRRPGSTFQCAYYEHDQVLIGLIYDPIRDLMLYAEAGMGVYMQTGAHVSRLEPRTPAPWSQLRFAHHRTYMTDTYRRVYASLGVQADNIIPTGSIGSKSLDFALDKVDCLVSLHRHIGAWDWAPGKVILEELGYAVSHLAGGALDIRASAFDQGFGYLVCPAPYKPRLEQSLSWLTDKLSRRWPAAAVA
ncbi:MAG: inositol monophosphatase family protein [Bacteroidia bacterium]|nr:inositol monophosphatase family protein [Bacteroidia bacterium]